MRRLLPLLVFLAVLGGLVAFFWPELQYSRKYAALLRQPAPVSLPNPLENRALVDTWGGPRSGGRKHEGIDIFAPKGTPIRATTEGVVLHVGENPLGGQTVTIFGPGAQRHYYAHLDRYADLHKGDWVEEGDTIGYVGNTGNAKTTPPHLHYGIYTAQGPINPYPLLRAWHSENLPLQPN